MDIEPYLTFDGNCEEALEFYAKCLGGKVTILMRYAGSPMDTAELPAQWKNKVMHATLEADGKHLMASDNMPGRPFKGYSGITVSINIPKDAARASKSSTRWRRAAALNCRSRRPSGARSSACSPTSSACLGW